MAHGPDLFPAMMRHRAFETPVEPTAPAPTQPWRVRATGVADDVIAAPPPAAGAPGVDIALRAASGTRVMDADGAELLDVCMGYGAQLLGHAHPAVTAALARQLSAGWQLGLPSPTQHELARLIQSAAPANERVNFCTSGSDAVLLAMRAARALTGRDVIGIFAGSFHGLHDYGLVSGEPDPAEGLGLTRKVHLGAGIPHVIDHAVSVLPYGHPAAFDIIRRQRQELAAIVVEPVRANDPHGDAGPWLTELAAVCRQAGVLFILDENVTGFRLAFGGAQETFGLAPDLVVYGKAVGGGLPLGVVAGRADFMRVFTAGAGAQEIFAASTFAGNPLSIAAGFGALQFAAANKAEVYDTLAARTAQLADGLATIAAELGLPLRVARAGSIFKLCLGPSGSRDRSPAARKLEDALALLVLRHGVLMQAGLRGYLSSAHTATDVALILAALRTALAELKSGDAFQASR